MTSLIKSALALTAAASMLTSVAHADTFDTVEFEADAILSTYEKVYIAPVEVDFSEHRIRRNIRDINSIRPVSELDQARKADDFAEDLEREFGKRYTLVDAPGEDVLTIETTLTKLVSTRPTIADRRATNVNLSFQSVYAGGADYQIQLSEGDTLIATIEENQSSNTLNDGRPRIGIWQDTNRSFNRFSRQLARYVERN